MLYSPLRVRINRPTAGLTSTCLHTEVKGHPASLEVMYGQYVEFPDVVGFLNQDYSFKSVVTQITHDYEFASARDRTRNAECEVVTLPLCYGGEHILRYRTILYFLLRYFSTLIYSS